MLKLTEYLENRNHVPQISQIGAELEKWLKELRVDPHDLYGTK